MNKRELIAKVSEQVGLTKKEVGSIIDATTKIIKNALSEGKKVTLVDFGTFRVLNRKARKGVNPQTGEAITISAKKAPKFKVGRGLREAVE